MRALFRRKPRTLKKHARRSTTDQNEKVARQFNNLLLFRRYFAVFRDFEYEFHCSPAEGIG
jgi:hypothetical protein